MKPKRIIFNSQLKNIRSVCSHCGNFFSEGEEVILCPSDNAPHHGKCWEINGGCSKGDFKDDSFKKKKSSPLFKKFIVIAVFFIIIVISGIIVLFISTRDNEVNNYTYKPVLKKTATISEPSSIPTSSPTPIQIPETPLPAETTNPQELKPFETKTPVPVKKPTVDQRIVKKEKNIETIQEKAVKIALKQIGKPYIWEATGPDAFDCAGLCGYAYWMASEERWEEWHIFYVSDMLKLCNIHRDFSEIQPGDLLVRNNYQYLKPFDVRNEEGPEYDKYDTHGPDWPYGESPVNDYGHIGMYAGKVTYGGVHYKNAVIEARGKDWGVVICELDRDGDGQIEWGRFFYRPKKL